MNRQESAWVLVLLAAPYPGEFADDTAEVWHNSTLANADFDEACEVAELLIKHEEYRPTPAVFNRELRIRRQHERTAAPGRAALEPAPGTPPSDLAVMIARLKDQLAADSAREHWHGGPTPCYVCGGMQPRKVDAASIRDANNLTRRSP